MLCRPNDLIISGENACVTVNSREGGRINVFEERSLNDYLVDASLYSASMRNIHIFSTRLIALAFCFKSTWFDW